MPRLNRKGELFSHIKQVRLIRDSTASPGNTTLSAAPVAGAGTISVASITNFAVAETIKVGNGERTEIRKIHPLTAPSAGVITLDTTTPLLYGHDIGEVVVEQAFDDLGPLSDAGLIIEHTGSVEDVNASTRRMLFSQLTGYYNIRLNFELLGFNVENLALAFAMNAARVLGAGTTAQPRVLTIGRDDEVGEFNDMAFEFLGARKDGTTVKLTAMACEIEPSPQFTVARGVKVPIPLAAKVTAGLYYERYN